jgi:putative NADH-flavin reductase
VSGEKRDVKIAVIGASGWLGGAIAREALARGHEVTGIGRNPSHLAALEVMAVARADATDTDSIAKPIAGHDAVVSAVVDRSSDDRSVIPRAARALLEALPQAGVRRLLFVGGGGTLEDETGTRFLDRPDFPPEHRAEALAGAEALAIFGDYDGEVEWTYLSPAPVQLVPGEKSGSYRVEAGDRAIFDEHGDNRITSGDLAAAAVDELEQGRFVRERFTAAY